MADSVDGGQGDGGQGDGGQQTPPAEPTITMTQAELDSRMARNRRGVQNKLDELTPKAQAFDVLNSQVQNMIESGLVDGVENIDEFKDAVENVIRSTRSEAENAKRDMESLTVKLKKAEEAREASASQYANAMISRQISDDAADLVVEGPGREGAIEYFQLKLGQLAKFDSETGEVGVNWKVTNEDTGRVEDAVVSVQQALKAMEANPSKYGRYFRSTVNSGDGGEVLDGVKRTSDGGIDFSTMSPAKQRELMKTNPGLLKEAAEKLTF